MNENELLNLTGIKYTIDFRLIPKIFFSSPTGILGMLMEDEARDIFCSIYNDAYEGKRSFTKDDFNITRIIDEDDFIYYVTLPDEHDGSMVWCEAYGFVFVRDDDLMNAQFFTLEKSNANTTMLCGISTTLDHMNFGEASDNHEENAKRMLDIAKRNKKNDKSKLNF